MKDLTFVSWEFLIGLTFVVVVTRFLRHKQQNYFLLGASWLFYVLAAGWPLLILLLGLTSTDYLAGREMLKHGPKRSIVAISVTIHMLALLVFKYLNFFASSSTSIARFLGLDLGAPVIEVLLPLGISFYTFKSMSYVIDVWRQKVKATKSYPDYALYVAFFPTIVAGPIEKAHHFWPQIVKNRPTLDGARATRGLTLLALGMFKKVVIADQLAGNVAAIFHAPGEASSVGLFTGMVSFGIQLYADFSGYTDMARGISVLLGFELIENFETPYWAWSVTNFWRRWHISMSSWFKEYLYVPLGGNQKGGRRTCINLFVVACASGLWHGAAWTFVVWGAIHGTGLVIERLGLKNPQEKRKTLYGRLLMWLWTMSLVFLAWVVFRSADLSSAWVYLQRMLTFTEGENYLGAIPVMLSAVVLINALDYLRRVIPREFMYRHTLALGFGVGTLTMVTVAVSAGVAAAPFFYAHF